MAVRNVMMQGSGGGSSGLGNGTVLWTNPAPTASFSGQTVTLSQSYRNFEYIGIQYKSRMDSTNTSRMPTIICSTEDFSNMSANASSTVGNRSVSIGLVSGTDSGSGASLYRYVYPSSDTGVFISTVVGASGANAAITPLQIIGY